MSAAPGPIVVAGFHRSGTSFATGLLQEAGLHIGDDLIGAVPSNPFGHFEDRGIVRFHDALLADNGLDWTVTSPFVPVVSEHRWAQLRSLVAARRTGGMPWGFKDPRVCLFLPLWRHVVPDLHVVVVHRPWQASVASLIRRHTDGLERGVADQRIHRKVLDTPDLGVGMWLNYTEALLAFTDAHPQAVLTVSFRQLQTGYPLAEQITARWGVALSAVDTTATFDPAATIDTTAVPPVDDARLLLRVAAAERRLAEMTGDPR